MSSNKKRKARLGYIETLEARRFLTGEGTLLPIATFAPSIDQQLMPTSDGQISLGAMADLNSDGQLDYAVGMGTSTGAQQVAFFLANGSQFAKGNVDAYSDNYFVDIAQGDINGDGITDIVVASQNVVRTYLNQGMSADNQWLGMERHQEVTLAATSITLADLNSDGRDDLVMATERRVDVRFSDNNAKFNSGIWYANAPGRKVVTTGDVNKDGNIDLVTGLAESQTAVVLLNDGDGFMAESQTLTDVKPSRKIKLLDVNADNNLDLVAGGENQEEANVLIWYGGSDGMFPQGSVGFETVGSPLDFDLGDVNNDGLQDLVVGHDGTFHHPINDNGPGGVSVLLATSAGLQPPIRLATPGASNVQVEQINGETQILAIRQWNNVVSTFTWDDQTLADAAYDYSEELANPFSRRESVFGDFNADGITDSVVSDIWTENAKLDVYIGKTDGSYDVTPLDVAAGLRVADLFVGDFNGDGKDDLGLQIQVGQEMRLASRVSNGDGTFQDPITANLPVSFGNFQILDVNNDGRDDLVGFEAESISTWVVTAKANEDGTWITDPSKLLLTGRFASELRVLDLNGDSILDAVMTSFQGVEISLGTPDGTFGASTTPEMQSSFHTVGDVNGDGFVDVVGGGFGELELSIAFGNASGTYDVATGISVNETIQSANGLAAVDVGGDGTDEIVIFRDNGFYLLRTDGNGGFLVTEHAIGFYPNSILLQEVTGDALPDLIVSPGANFIGGSPTTNLAVLPGTAGGQFMSPIVVATSLTDGLISGVEKQPGRIDFFVQHRQGFGKISGALANTLTGDFDEDGLIDPDDIDLLCGASHQTNLPAEDVTRFDQNSDGAVNAEDVDTWLSEVANTQRGDADLDGDVDFADFLGLSANFGMADATWSQGDFDCDGEVGFGDFLLLSSNFGK